MQSTDATDSTVALASISRPLVDLRTGEQVGEIRTVEQVELPRVAYKPAEVAEMLGVGERYVWTLIETGQLKAVKVANRRQVLAEDLIAFVEELKAERERARGAA